MLLLTPQISFMELEQMKGIFWKEKNKKGKTLN